MRRVPVSFLFAAVLALCATSAFAQVQQPGFGGPTRARQASPTVEPTTTVSARTPSWLRVIEARLLAVRDRIVPTSRFSKPARTK